MHLHKICNLHIMCQLEEMFIKRLNLSYTKCKFFSDIFRIYHHSLDRKITFNSSRDNIIQKKLMFRGISENLKENPFHELHFSVKLQQYAR